MNERKINIDDILGRTMVATAPMLTGLVKSVLSPQMIKSAVGMLPDLLNAAVDAISSIDLGEILSAILGAILPVAMRLLDHLLDILGPIIEGLLDMLAPVLEIVGPIFDALAKIIRPIVGALTKG